MVAGCLLAGSGRAGGTRNEAGARQAARRQDGGGGSRGWPARLAAVGSMQRAVCRCSGRLRGQGRQAAGTLWRAVRIRRGLAGNDPYRSASCELLPDRAGAEPAAAEPASGREVRRTASCVRCQLARWHAVGWGCEPEAPGSDNESASLHTSAWPLYVLSMVD